VRTAAPDGQAAGGDRVSQGGHEVVPGERVQRGDGLVEQQQPGPLGQRQCQCHLGALPPGQRAHRLAEGNVEALQPLPYGRGVPVGVEVRADADVVLGGHAPVERDLLGEEADVGEEGRVLAGCAAQDGHVAAGRPGQPGEQP
jgi:hypothetical protein